MVCTVYLLRGGKKRDRSYIGATQNVTRRVRQHNGEITGGARNTRRAADDPLWVLVRTVTGFDTWHECLRFEHHVKHLSRVHGHKPLDRVRAFEAALALDDRWKHLVYVDTTL